MCNNTHCHFSITDVVDVDENIEVMLFCSFYDCLPEDTPVDCNANELIAEYNDNASMVVNGEEIGAEEVNVFLSDHEDEVPF